MVGPNRARSDRTGSFKQPDLAVRITATNRYLHYIRKLVAVRFAAAPVVGASCGP
jgi:hypothetical protein